MSDADDAQTLEPPPCRSIDTGVLKVRPCELLGNGRVTGKRSKSDHADMVTGIGPHRPRAERSRKPQRSRETWFSRDSPI